jgi:hypothetical protein
MAGKRTKRFDEGGVVGNTNYPFGQGQVASAAPSTSTGLGNNSPLVQVNTPVSETAAVPVATVPDTSKPFGMKKGGKVNSFRRGDGIAQRGKTRGRMI